MIPTLEIAKRVGRITHSLRVAGKIIGAHDIWIAATALHLGAPVISGDVQDFERVDGLVVIPWTNT